MRSPKNNVDKFSHLACLQGKQVRGNYEVGCGDDLRMRYSVPAW